MLQKLLTVKCGDCCCADSGITASTPPCCWPMMPPQRAVPHVHVPGAGQLVNRWACPCSTSILMSSSSCAIHKQAEQSSRFQTAQQSLPLLNQHPDEVQLLQVAANRQLL
jgi:hypothetical protein